MNASEYARQRMQLTDKFKSSRPESTDWTDSTPIHQITQFQQVHAPGQISGAEGATEAHSEVGDPATGAAWEEPTPRETTGTVLRLHVGTVAHGPTKQEKNARPQTKNATIVEDLDIFSKVCRQRSDYQISEKTVIKHIDTWRNSPQTTFRVSTPPHTLSPMSKQKPQSSVSRLKLESITFKARTQNISDPYGQHSLDDPKSFRLTVKSIQEQAATSYQPTKLNNCLAMND